MSEPVPSAPGIYIVTLNTNIAMPVTRDKRYVDICAKVDKSNVKVGKAKNLAGRQMDYWKDFDKGNVNFTPVAILKDIEIIEGQIKKALWSYRVKSPKGGRLEWMAGIETEQVRRIVLTVLKGSGLEYQLLI